MTRQCDAIGSTSTLVDDKDVAAIESFVRYIYEEYWSDDLAHDRFVPTPCITAHFTEDISWTYGDSGGSMSSSDETAAAAGALDLVGTYTGRDGMSTFLAAWGARFKVEAWAPASFRFHGLVAEVSLDARYRLRATGAVAKVREEHRLELRQDPNLQATMPVQIATVSIAFDQAAMVKAFASSVEAAID
eukprot:TRINITY_DN51552_c0_g1_i1.p1 TRINITY_DN51552_c0_g1~~TRINITY_DN51552_c0_g1_i1.p1  ORF type:complete len:189 (-),score=32.40 TRINITY_DN51552_c0_g1_i1:123-689(-)